METIKLKEHEIRHFGELFSQCDVDSSGRVLGPKASELFITSGLSTETLHQVCNVMTNVTYSKSIFFCFMSF